MLYAADLIIPANTLKGAPATLDVSLVVGVIEQVEIQIPYGCRGMVHTRALRGASQVFPSGPDQTFKGNGSPIRWDEHYELTDEPLMIRLHGWSPGTSFQHVITWRFALSPFALGEFPVREKAGVARRLFSLLGV